MLLISYITINMEFLMETPFTTQKAIQNYIESIRLARSPNTARSYANALKLFAQVLTVRNLPPENTPPADLPEDSITWMADTLKPYLPATERLYMTAVIDFFEYLETERLASHSLTRIRQLARRHTRRAGIRLPQFPRDAIEKVLEYVKNITNSATDDEPERLRALRDRAFLLTLADTGLRVHEACNLRRGDVDWSESRAVVIGKGDKQAVVRFSNRAIRALRDYLSTRAALDGSSGRPLPSLPLFARHDKGAGKKIKPITTATGRNIVTQRVTESLGAEAVGTITPHSFRHYFVTTVLRASGNLKLAQELARHSNLSTTSRYAHLSDDELDKGYHEIFED